MTTYDAGQAALSVVPTFKGVTDAIETAATEAGKQFVTTFNDVLRAGLSANLDASQFASEGDRAAEVFGDAFKARIDAVLRDLPEAKIDGDTSEFDDKLAFIRAQLQTLRDVTIGVDLSDAGAVAELESIKAQIDELAARSPDISVRADVDSASAELAALQAELAALGEESPTIRVDVDAGTAEAELAVVGAEAETVGEESPTVRVSADTSSAASDISTLLVLIASLGPALVPIGAAAIAGLGGIATVAASGAAGLGVLTLGLSGLSGAVKLLGQEQTASASDSARAATAAAASGRAEASAAASVVSATEALKNARETADQQAIASAEQVANARQSLADAERRAADEIVTASEQVTQAKYAEALASQNLTNAQNALNAAHEQAARDLESDANSEVDANLSVEQSTIDLANAVAQYQADLANPAVTALQLEQDQLNVAKATQAKTEAEQQAANATEDNNKAQAAGVDGAKGVVSATEQVAQAKHAQLTAEQNLTDAIHSQAETQQSAAESIAKAQQGLTDAIRNQTNQQRQSAYAVQAAENSLADAMRSVANANAEAGTTGETALQKIQDKLALVNPATLQLATFIRNTVEPAFKQLQQTAAAGLGPGIEQALQNLTPLFAPLNTFVGDLAKTMGNLAVQASKALTDPFWTKFFAYIAATAGPTITTFAHIVGDLAKGFAGLLQAFAPITAAIGAGLEKLAGEFANFGSGNSNGLTSFIDYIKTNGPLVVSTFGKIFDAIGHIIQALAPLGPVVLQGLGLLSTVISAIPTPILTAVATAIAAIVLSLKAAAIITAFAEAIAGLAAGFAVLTGAATAADFALDANPIGALILVIGLLVVAIYELATHWSTVWNAIKAVFSAVVDGIELEIQLLITFFTKTIPGALNVVLDFAKAHWPLLLDILTGPIGLAVTEIAKHWSAIESGAKSAFDAVVNFAKALPGRIVGALASLGGDLLGIVVGSFQAFSSAVRSGFTDVVSFVASIPGKIVSALEGLAGDLVNAGEQIVKHIADGIVSGITGFLSNAVGAVTGFITSHLPGSPVRQGPLTVLNDGYAGGMITQMIADGIASKAYAVQAAIAGVTGGMSINVPIVTASSGLITPTSDFASLSYAGDVRHAVPRVERAAPTLSSDDMASLAQQPSGPYTVYAQFGEETIEARSIRVAHDVVDNRVSAAKQRQDRGVGGGTLAHLERS